MAYCASTRKRLICLQKSDLYIYVVSNPGGGVPVNAVLLVLDDTVGLEPAMSLLWRRETANQFSGKEYSRPVDPTPNQVVVECIRSFHGCDVALYTKIGSNIEDEDLHPDHLADLAIRSAHAKAGANRKDGISYLASVIRQEITTPLLPEYRDAILRKTGAGNLVEAHAKIRDAYS